jgi:hypothetical protein
MSFARITDFGCWLRQSFLKACQEKLKCQTMGIDFSDEGWKDQSAHFKGFYKSQKLKT